MPDESHTLPEVAQLLKVAEKMGCTMARTGELPFEVRGEWRFKRVDLDQSIERQKAGALDDKHRGDA